MAATQAMAHLRFSPLSTRHHFHRTPSSSPSRGHPRTQKLYLSFSRGGFGGGVGRGGGGEGEEGGGESESSSVVGMVVDGWRSRVAADPQFPFKVLMEELVGVSAAVVGDMATRPNFGLSELDFVFSTLVVGSILNLILMYLLAPTVSTSSSLPWMFATCPSSHMFEAGPFGVVERCGTLLYKGGLFAAVGLGAGLLGTAISNGLIAARKRVDPTFQSPNKPPPTLLNAFTWAAHMGLSSNLRYQTLNGVEFLLVKLVPPFVFKSSVFVLRLLNNVLGGITFVTLARLTGSQPLPPHNS
ncbi:hypothetical protein Fmac_028408 [Flemingia macrophylla]|uniref:Uncharacterized protein n=1 Tax=Flemingia macrophylla TaxID=520843 RepID=A0ABD1L7F1_9FABA